MYLFEQLYKQLFTVLVFEITGRNEKSESDAFHKQIGRAHV